MSIHDESMDEGEWTTEDRSLLAALPAERIPSHEMKQGTLDAARAAGYLVPLSRGKLARTIALFAAASLIFVTGTMVGYALARRASPPANAARSTNDVTNVRGFTITIEPRRDVVWY